MFTATIANAKSAAVLLLVVATTFWSGTGPLQKPDSRVLKQTDIEVWVDENYDQTVRQIFPGQAVEVDHDSLPDKLKWVVTARVIDPYRQGEFWFSLRKDYDDHVEVTARVPDGKPISAQLAELKKSNPTATLQSISTMVRIKEHRWTDEQLPGLRNLVTQFESVKMSAEMPDSLMNDPVEYYFWTMSHYGQTMQVRLIGPGPQATKQPHPLIKLAEDFRVLLEKQSAGGPGVK